MLVVGTVLVGSGVDVEVAGTVLEGEGEEVAAAARKQHARSAALPGMPPAQEQLYARMRHLSSADKDEVGALSGPAGRAPREQRSH